MKILVIDDEKNIRRSMEMILCAEGHRVLLAEEAGEGLRLAEREQPELIFLDVCLPGEDGLSLLKKIKSQQISTEVVMISGHATLSMAVEATRSGAYDFLEKPLQKEKILILIRHLAEKQHLQQKYRALEETRVDEYRMIGESPALQAVHQQIERAAPTDSKVLIRGESGTGKELVAWAVHHRSPRAGGPFVKMNCAAIPEELTESELFGHEKGAFTGAAERREGKFRQADGGTLFLDEIADMSLKVQTKVLRVLQDGRFERVGGKETLSADVRVVAATNKNLEELVSRGEFREDLYYRLNVLPIMLPPLRDRREDIGLLLEHFIAGYCVRNNRRPVRVAPEALEILKAYPWPGNIRELKNLAERLLIMSSGEEIGVEDLPTHLLHAGPVAAAAAPGTLTLKEVREAAEREYIRASLAACRGNVSRAAVLLGMERTNLHKKMKALGMDREG